MSLYGKYIKERAGKEIIEDDRGFATYYYLNDGVYIENIYVLEDYRKTGVASNYANQIASIAKEKGCVKMFGSVSPKANGSTDSLKVLLAYGFKLDSSVDNFIALVKEI